MFICCALILKGKKKLIYILNELNEYVSKQLIKSFNKIPTPVSTFDENP